MADEVKKRKIQVLTAGGAPLRTHTAIFVRKQGERVRFITEDGKTFDLPATEVQISDPIEGKVTKTKKGAAAAPSSEAPRVGRENTLRGMTGNQRTFDAGNAMQRRIYRSLKTTTGWYSLSLAERIEANISALKKAGVSNDLIPGVVDQMSRQYFSGKGAAESKRGQEAIAVLEKFAGSRVTGGVRRIISRGVSARRAMGAGNVYNEEGKVEKRTGKSRREIIKTGSRGGTSRVPTPVGGYSAKGKEVSTAREKALAAAKRVSEGLAAIDEMPGSSRRFGKAKFKGAPEGAVEKKLEIVEERVIGQDKVTGDPIKKGFKKTVTLLFKDGMYYIPKDGGYEARSKAATKEYFLQGGVVKSRKVSKSSPTEGKGKATTKFLLRESRIGARMNDERLVTIAKEMIAQARKTGNIPKEGGYTALLLKQPQFEGIDSKDLRRIVALAKADTRMAKVERREKKRGAREKTDRKVKLSPTGRDITDEVAPRTRKGKETRAAVAAAEEQIVREDFSRRDVMRKDKKREQIRGEKTKGAMRPAKPISIAAARKMEQEIAEGKKPSPVFKKRTTKQIVKEAAAAGKVRISEPRLSKRDREALALLEKLPDRASRNQAADMMKMSTKVRSKAMSKNLLSLAGMYGANYILSQLGEEGRKKKRG